MRTPLALLSALALATTFAACGDDGGGDGGGDALEALCDDETVDAIDELLGSEDVPDFDEARDALDVVAEAAEGDLDDQVETVEEAIDIVDDALEGVDLDDDEAVGEALAEVEEDAFDSDELDEAIQDIAEFVDDECDTDLLAVADDDDEEPEEAGRGEVSEAFCAQAAALADDDTLDELDFTDPDDMALALSVLEDFRDSAPDAIRDDLGRVVEAFISIEEIVRENEGDLEAQNEAFEALEEEFADVEAATERVEDFVLEACGVDISDDDGDEPVDDGGLDDGGLEEAGDPDEPPAIDDPELADLAERCFEGSGQACDDLFFQSPVDSEAEDYGDTCGGRFDESPGFCATAIGE